MPLNVTKSFLPPLEEYTDRLKIIWETHTLTNGGALTIEFERRMCELLGVKHFLFMSNGTLALQLALRGLDVKREVITTPFTYVATASSIIWEQCVPVFVDVDPNSLCIDPALVERAIGPNTDAIMGVHVYGNPCDVDALSTIANRAGVKLIFDGAHAFGVRVHDRPICSWGDVTTLSFHATKLFHTVEGGGIATNDDALARRIGLMRSFGHRGDEYYELGINAKNTEFHAAMGLCNLKYLEEHIGVRRRAFQAYDAALTGVSVRRMPFAQGPGSQHNFSYYPVIFESEVQLLKVQSKLADKEIFARRYFYPSLNRIAYMVGDRCPVAEDVASRVLCLPLSSYISLTDIQRVAEIIKSALG